MCAHFHTETIRKIKSKIIRRCLLRILGHDSTVHIYGHVDPAIPKQNLQLIDRPALAQEMISEGVAEAAIHLR